MSTQYAVVDPTTNERVQEFPTATDDQVTEAVQAANAAFTSWRDQPLSERAQCMHRVAEAFRADRKNLAAIITREMGKVTDQALAEVDLVADIFDYYASHGAEFAADENLPTPQGEAVLRSEPLGPLLGIMPWNYPYYQIARFAAPNLVLGNTLVLKPAPSCPESSAAMAQIIHDAGVPTAAYQNLYATNDQVATIIADPAIQGVSLTGSDRAGKIVAELAGRYAKKVLLELGGSDPFIVLSDADISAAVEAGITGRMGNTGQACNASKRFIVLDEVYDQFLAEFTQRTEAVRIGDPSADGVDVGPLSSEAAAEGVREQVDDAVAHGATLHLGGHRIDRAGAFYEPTILTDVPENAPAYREEIFGPVAVIHRVADVDAAVKLANDTPYGLGSVIFGTDKDRINKVADQLEVGMVSINAPSQTAPELPFGGVKSSGIGRELGPYGMAEFVNKKLIRTP